MTLIDTAVFLYCDESICFERKALIINTNIELSRWVNVLYNEQIAVIIPNEAILHFIIHIPIL